MTDNAIAYLIPILEYMPSLTHLNLSGNQITGLKNFENFLLAILRDLQLQTLNLSLNKLKDSTIDLIIPYIFKQPELSIKQFDISRNDYSNLGQHRLLDSYHRCPNKGTMKLLFEPLPFHSSVVSKLLDGQEKIDNIDITIERISLNNLAKRLPTRSSEFHNIFDILKKIEAVKGSSVITVEEIARICNKIYSLEYEFPPQKLELLYFVLRKKIQQAISETNNYATDILLKAAQQIGLGIQEFEDDIKHIKYINSSFKCINTNILSMLETSSDLNRGRDAESGKSRFRLGQSGSLKSSSAQIKNRIQIKKKSK